MKIHTYTHSLTKKYSIKKMNHMNDFAYFPCHITFLGSLNWLLISKNYALEHQTSLDLKATADKN